VSEPLAEPFDAILELAGEPLREAMASVEQRLHEIAGIELHALHTIEAGGKRLRPLLVFVAGLGSGAHTALCRAAAAVELIHSATLVHDDVLDDAPLRRGRVTIYAAAGRDAATSTGDLLFSSAFAELARNESIAQLASLSAASSALARGELMQRADAWRSDVTLERYLERCELKTARLFAAACELGALAGDGPRLGPFGRAVGLAFQILDDVLDITGPAERTGKRPGADQWQRDVATDPRSQALDGARVARPPRHIRTRRGTPDLQTDRGDRRRRTGSPARTRVGRVEQALPA
jgi:geranylgeranyl pyrophosphate synthase